MCRNLGEMFATVLFACVVGRVASSLLSKLVDLYHRVTYVAGP
jgi:predicted tellurium resistance membrane protein TerC